jgi:AcrR family transcriptional regulator
MDSTTDETPDAAAPNDAVAAKEKFRSERHRAFLNTALRIINTESISALTMPRLADELECGIGTLYRHFPSKDALMVELQREALDVIATSFLVSRTHLDELLEAREIDDPAIVALARVVGALRYWIAAEEAMPKEIELLRRMFVDPTLHMDDKEIQRTLPASWGLLDLARVLLDDAVDAGALRKGPSQQRAVIVIAGTTGVMLTSGLERWDDELFHGHELAALLSRDLLIGWGADEAMLDQIDAVLDELERAGRLVPAVPRLY